MTVWSPPPVADVPAPLSVTLAGAFQDTPCVQLADPAGMTTVSPARTRFSAFRISGAWTDSAEIVAAFAAAQAVSRKTTKSSLASAFLVTATLLAADLCEFLRRSKSIINRYV